MKARFLFVLFFISSLAAFSQGTWTNSYVFHSRHLNSIFLTDYYHHCIVGGNKSNDSIQSIYLSTDAGSSYNMVTDSVSSWLKSVYFTSFNNGITVGAYGKVLKTTDGGNIWNPVTIPGSVVQRNFNSVFFVDALNGFIAGGRQNNDSISTILKTTDGGNTWTVSKDVQGYWLRSIHFPSADIGYAVGDNGLLLKTIDAGATWVTKSIPGSAGTRNFSSVFFTSDQVGYIVGGNMLTDTIRTILKTVNGGDSWTILFDSISPVLNDVFFINANEGYIVGYKGTVLHTADAGNTWQDIVITGNDPLFKFNSVRFLNPKYGYIVGDWGIVFRYFENSGQGPDAITQPASGISLTDVQLNGIVNANSYATTIEFEYGTNTNYGNTISGIPSSVNGTNNVNITASLSGLLANTLYHFRIKAANVMATNVGDDMQFYTGNSTIPNFNFENWDTTTFIVPDSFDMTSGKISKISTACHGNFAVRIENDSASENLGVLLIGKSDEGQNFYGGAPFNARPDTLIGCFNYSIIPNDTAIILLFLKKEGTIIANNFFKIYGNSAGNYQTLKFPITYSSADTPDSIIFGIVCTDFRYLTQILLGSYLDIDYIRFSGTTETIPNFDFENWYPYDHITLNNWCYSRKNDIIQGADLNLPVLISTDAYSGNYAALVRNVIQPSDTIEGRLNSGSCDNINFSINYKPNSLTGFYKFYPQNGDSLYITIQLFFGTQWIGIGEFKTGDMASEYTPFSAYIKGNNPLIPDSANITVQIYKDKPLGNSYAIIDDFNFDGFWAGVTDEPIVQATQEDIDFIIYPNPFNNSTTINFSLEQPEEIQICLYDISGKEILKVADKKFEYGDHKVSISGVGLQRGFYICTITSKIKRYCKIIIVY